MPLAGPASLVVLGALWGAWAMALPSVKHAWGLSDAGLGWLLACSVGVAGLGGLVVARLGRRLGARRLLGVVLSCFGVAVCLPSLAHGFSLFVVAFILAQAAGGVIDSAGDAVAGVYLEGRAGAMTRLHALFNVGAMGAALASTAALANHVSWRWLWPVVGAVALVVGIGSLRGEPGRRLDRPIGAIEVPGEEQVWLEDATARSGAPAVGRREGRRRSVLVRDGLVGYFILFGLLEVVEGGAFTWGVLYLRVSLGAGILAGLGAYCTGHVISTSARLLGGRLRDESSTRWLLGACALAGAGLVVEAGVHNVVAAGAGLGIAVGALGIVWPVMMSVVSRASREPVRAIGRFTAMGYAGWVGGAPAVGYLSDHFGGRCGLYVMGGIGVVCALGGRAIMARRSLDEV
jgi:MFS family permease